METIFRNLNGKEADKETACTSVYHISNRDGSVRWLWSSKSKQPDFLNFYHASNLKAKLFIIVIRALFALKLQHLVFAKTKRYVSFTKNSPLFAYRQKEFFVFTGTAGPNRKYVILLKDNNGSFFKKWGINNRSTDLIQKEREAIKKVGQLKGNVIHLPLTFQPLNEAVVLEKFDEATTQNFTINQARILTFLQNNTFNFSTKREFFHTHDFLGRLKAIASKENKRVPFGILHKLEHLAIQFNPLKLGVCWAHGDFTPWNMKYLENGELYVYDWEMFDENYPMFFDFFHFFFQKAILVERQTWMTLKVEMEEAFKTYMDEEYYKDYHHYLEAYLLINTLNQLEIFEDQEDWHVQVNWLLNMWNEALSDLLQAKVNVRELVLADTFDFLHKAQYGLLKASKNNPYAVEPYSDVDICIEPKVANLLIEFLKTHVMIHQVKIQSWSYRKNVALYLTNGDLLNLDLVFDFKRKSLNYFSRKEALQNLNTDEFGIQYLNPINAAKYVALFYGLNGQTIPVKYKAGQRVLDGTQSKLIASVQQRRQNKGVLGLINKLVYFYDCAKTVGNQKGFTISFSGVDGAGKSTIIEKAKLELEKKYRRRVVVLRHRPSILPILSAWKYGKKEAEKKSVESLPRKGHNKSLISSFFRFSYYYIDYLIGQFYVQFKYVLKGDIVLYDRFYYDFIHDGVRSNIRLPKWIMRFGSVFILKPSYNFFLYAEPEVILRRKKELKYDEIVSLNGNYLNYFTKQSGNKNNQFLAIKNKDLFKTLNIIFSNVQLKLIP